MIQKLFSKAILLALLVAIISFSIGIVIGQETSFTLIKPYVMPITTIAPDLKIESVVFNFDVITSRYLSVDVTVKNYASVVKSGTIYVYLLDKTGNTVASSDLVTGSIGSDLTVTKTLTLLWVTENIVENVTSGHITVK